MRLDLAGVCARADRLPCVVVTVVATYGSTPREVGARMVVTREATHGSIGGGRLEHQEIAAARAVLDQPSAPWQRAHRRIILGPDAGQCCGGIVEVVCELITPSEAAIMVGIGENGGAIARPFGSGKAASAQPATMRLHVTGATEAREIVEPFTRRGPALAIYGAGHVARALIPIVAGLDFDLTWVDVSADRFPDTIPETVAVLATPTPATCAAEAAAGAMHLIMTHDHDLDWAICHALLSRDDVAFVGLIGSATKRARFVQRFRREGLADDAVSRLVCPIGAPGIAGKAPMAIAVAVAAQLLALRSRPDVATVMVS
jgi:xanthine dehydrogenase accessory factor